MLGACPTVMGEESLLIKTQRKENSQEHLISREKVGQDELSRTSGLPKQSRLPLVPLHLSSLAPGPDEQEALWTEEEHWKLQGIVFFSFFLLFHIDT